jgi:hypothetical protein|tara:strand:+ start:2775 stop:3002 length:228 start_codon:yes stop_codon:yes gene_type:complete
MKSIEKLKQEVGVIHFDDTKKIKFIIEELERIEKSKKINEDNLRVLSNCLLELGTLKDSFFWRLVKVLKQNHMID